MTKLPPLLLRGRLGSGDFFTLVGFVLIIRIIVTIAWAFDSRLETLLLASNFLLLLVGRLVSQRLHDAGHASIWGWLALTVSALVIPLGTLIVAPPAAGTPLRDVIPPWVDSASTVLLLAVVVFVGRLDADPGSNAYGPPAEPFFK